MIDRDKLHADLETFVSVFNLDNGTSDDILRDPARRLLVHLQAIEREAEEELAGDVRRAMEDRA